MTFRFDKFELSLISDKLITKYPDAEVNISPKINFSAQPLKKALHKTPEVQ